ncbi:hypothetical protein JCM10213v2_004185 [Rhodosporidiobolus nylandii]
MPLSLLSGPPPALDRDQLADISAATPASFDGIAPLLRHYEADGVRVRIDPAYQGLTGDGVEGGLWVTEGSRWRVPKLEGAGELPLKRREGTFFATFLRDSEGALSFFSASSGAGISIPYTHITLHAISRSSAPSSDSPASSEQEARPCVYVQFEEDENAEESDDYDGSGSREMWITPKEAENVDKIFATLSYCCSLHPTTSTSAPGVLSDSTNGESSSHFNDPSAALFASMGLDPESMVYAGADGELAGPGLATLQGDENGADGQWEDVEEEQQQTEGGRQRSDFVNPGRARGAPY